MDTGTAQARGTSGEDAAPRIDGVMVGALVGFAPDGRPMVVFPGNPGEGALAARSTAVLGPSDLGASVALLFEGGDPLRPLVVGRLVGPPPDAPPAPAHGVEVVRDGERLRLTATEEIELRCGKASIILTRDGKVLVRGAYVSSWSTGANRIRGGSVNLN